ncbi:acyltransferase family protein [Cryptosporangium aurantiacum]|uniref:acyltransferase family protein n=1 Tax=Cryptosporangium aurantiacum TaxID=134849 RepID=UPI002481FF7F|nr:acyltransferase family protein [Cryptosporangium aurantiacum]
MTAPAPKTAPAKGRDRYLDTLRAVAIIRVVTYHAFGFAWFPWFPAMGVMFALAGTLMVRSVDKSPFQAVKSRYRRLLPVLWAFAAIWIPLMIWHDGAPSEWGFGTNGDSPIWQLAFWILPLGDPPGSEWGETAWGVLWYLKTYLWFVALSPLLLKVFRKAPWLVLLSPFALLGLAELGILPMEDWWGSTLNDVLVYLGCWLIGFAHAEGIIKRLPLPALFAIGGVTIAAALGWLAGPGNTQALEAGGQAWFVENSSLTLALYSFGVVFILMRYSSRMEWLQRHRVIDRIITIFNSRAVTIYLWHNAALVVAMGITDRVGLYPWIVWFPLAWVLIGVAVLVFGWIEDVAAKRKPELLPGKTKAPAISVQPGSSDAPGTGAPETAAPASPAPAGPVSGGHYGSAAPYGHAGPQQPYDPYRRAGQPAPAYGGAPHYDAPHYDAPHYDAPRYDAPRYDPPYADARHSDAQHTDPRQGGARYDDARHSDPRQGDPRQGDPRQGDPRQGDPQQGGARYDDAWHGDARHSDPRQGGSGYVDPRVSDPRYGRASPQPPQHGAPADGRYDARYGAAPRPRPGGRNDDPDAGQPDRGRYPAQR